MKGKLGYVIQVTFAVNMTLRLLNAYAKFLGANNMYYRNKVEFDRSGERSPQQQQSYSGLRLPGRSDSTYF